MARIQVFKSRGSARPGFYWRLLGNNGQVVAVSESYVTRFGARRGARRFKKITTDAVIEVQP